MNSEPFLVKGTTSKWYLNVQERSSSPDYARFWLLVNDYGKDGAVTFSHKLWIVTNDGSELLVIPEVETTYSQALQTRAVESRSIKFSKLYPAKEIENEDNAIYVCCEIQCRFPSEKLNAMSFETNMREQLWKSYNNGLSDSCILQIDKTQFKVSKLLLTAYSDVFERMFLVEASQESKTGIINISDINVKTMKALVQYLHLGTVDNLDEIAEDLFFASDKYNIIALRDECAMSLMKTLTTDNLFDRLKLAFMHENEILKIAVLNFISSNDEKVFVKLVTSSQWFQFASKNEQLAKEITEAVFKKTKYDH